MAPGVGFSLDACAMAGEDDISVRATIMPASNEAGFGVIRVMVIPFSYGEKIMTTIAVFSDFTSQRRSGAGEIISSTLAIATKKSGTLAQAYHF